ncbi:MAG TPA: hypothetical protein VLM42_12735, partial [Bryobacteraceae bacterium]|nr:hypothetical protein [Bryobacteraceae bacterium]
MRKMMFDNKSAVLSALLIAGVIAWGQAPRSSTTAEDSAPGFDLSGFWSPAMHEDALERGGGSEIGDYAGFALNEAGRLWAL